MPIGDEIRRRREALGITKAELGRRAGVTEVSISYWERGQIKQVGHERLLGLAAALDTTASELVGDPGLARLIAEKQAEALEAALERIPGGCDFAGGCDFGCAKDVAELRDELRRQAKGES